MLTFRTPPRSGGAYVTFRTSWREKTIGGGGGGIAQHYLDCLPDEYWVPSIRSWLSSGQLMG